eukprot:jgi/Astpho2/5700/Aster-02938
MLKQAALVLWMPALLKEVELTAALPCQAEAAAAAEADAGPGDDADWFLAEVETGVAMVDVQPDVLREQLEQLFPMMAEQQHAPLEHSLLDAASDDESTTTIGQHADSLIEEAHHALVVPATPMDDITSMLANVLNNQEVQQACCRAFRSDPVFADFVERAPHLDMHRFLPPSASACVVTEVANEQPQENDDVAVTWEAMLAAMGTSFIRIGDALQGAGEAVGRFFGSIGHAVHSKLRAASPHGERRGEAGSRPCQADMWMGALTTVAVAVLLMIVGSGKARLRPSTAT